MGSRVLGLDGPREALRCWKVGVASWSGLPRPERWPSTAPGTRCEGQRTETFQSVLLTLVLGT